ncbi:N-acetyltransferase [Sporosarcina sp. NCCP-2222]|uniref:GNAT family N-acetyltransferase n=1 Tax=Sporosarcina sp. NCCP-2222 TaxID=2935073 RepID=UPI002082E6E0|nr:GNAT family protein [Sporosarcina sp. NCCP-2222]GKV55325.1 N-acetyltransferase [Sporosarcina sp. NCCP-2222]
MINVKQFPVLETERLLLRQVTKEDAPSIFRYLSDVEVMKYYGLLPFKHVSEAEEEIEWYRSIFENGTGIRWGITLKNQPEQVIGSCGFLAYAHQHARTEVGAELAKEYWRSGIMTEAFGAVLEYGFKEMNLMRIQGLIDPANVASQKLVEKFGFLREGLLRNYERTGDKFEDVYMYALLQTEWNIS